MFQGLLKATQLKAIKAAGWSSREIMDYDKAGKFEELVSLVEEKSS